jgi:ABC-2 type transport system permease protein
MVGLYALAFLLNLTAALWSAGIALRARGGQATPGIVLPIFVLLFLSPVFLPLHLLTGWIHTVANYNPITRFLETGRSLLYGKPHQVPLAFGIAGGMVVFCMIWALLGVKSAERAGPP